MLVASPVNILNESFRYEDRFLQISFYTSFTSPNVLGIKQSAGTGPMPPCGCKEHFKKKKAPGTDFRFRSGAIPLLKQQQVG